MPSPSQILKELNLQPRKYLGQNFLVNQTLLKKIVQAARLNCKEQVLEVGPGLGFLTTELIKVAGKVLAVEKDRGLFDYLTKHFQAFKNLKFVNQDILRFPEEKLRAEFNNEPYKVVANLPYQITARFLRKFLDSAYPPCEMILLLQKEVAERLIAKPGDLSVLAVAVQFYAEPEILFPVRPGAFYPRPKVQSAVIRLNHIKKDRYPVPLEIFFRLVRQGFGSKRKQLKNNLHLAGDQMAAVGLPEKIRAQELSLEQWVKLAQALV